MADSMLQLNTFTGQTDRFLLLVSKTTSVSLQVKLVDTATFDEYFEAIDAIVAINSQTTLDVFEYISSHFNEILIDSGIIRFRFQLGSMKEARVFTIRPAKKKRQTLEQKQKQMKEFGHEMKVKDEKIKELIRMVRELKGQNQELKKTIKMQENNE